MAEEIRVPSLGESVTEATLAKWLKDEGEAVEADEPVAELETDKVAMEVNAPAAGVLTEHVVEEGAEIEVGALIARIDTEAKAAKKTSGAAKEQTGKTEKKAEKPPASGKEKDKDEDEAEAGGKQTADGGTGEMVDVPVPASGESVTEAGLGRWLKSAGDAVEADEPIAELETDKAAMEVNAPVAGVLAETLAEEGSTVSPGDVIARIQKGGKAKAASAGASEKKDRKETAAKEEAPAEPEPSGESPDRPMAPAVRRLVDEYNLDPTSIDGSGKDGRITKADVLGAIEAGTAKTRAAASQAPSGQAPADEAAPREERVAMTRLRKRIAERLKDAQNTAAMLTTFNDVDMSQVIAARKSYRDLFEKKHGVRLGFMSFFVKAAVMALKEVPQVNARIYGDEIVYQNFYDIGVAVSAPQGLVVPVVRDADRLSFAETEKTINDFGTRAREGKLAVNELQGGTFTISNGGIFGSLLSTPILNPPQSGILGMHRIEERPVARDGDVVVRPMMYLALSYDHRLVDGREAVTFLVRMKETIEDPSRLLLDL